MVNSHGITITKLSRLQKLIIQEIQISQSTVRDHIALETLSYLIARKYEPRITERTREREEANERIHGSRFISPPNFVKGGAGDETTHILSPKFKASFYRSLKRLENRGIISRGLRNYEEEGRRVHFTTIYLTEADS